MHQAFPRRTIIFPRWLKLFGAALFLVATIMLRGLAQTAPDFQQHVAPLLEARCAGCHNHTTRQGGLSVESYEALRNGGRKGMPFVAGKSAESLLIHYVEGTRQPRMPIGETLSAADIQLLKRWIDAGARGPQAQTTATNSLQLDSPPSTSPTNAANVATRAALPALKPTVNVNPAINSLAFRHDGAVLALGRYQQVELRAANTEAVQRTLAGLTNEARSVVFSPDGKWLAAAGGKPGQFGEISVWEAQSGQLLRTWRGHRDNIFALAVAPDGKTLATCSYDKLVKLWDVATGNERATLRDHTDAVFALAFSPDGKWLASGAADRTVKLWDVATGQRLYTLSDALDTVNALAFHPSGQWLAGAGADRIIHIWQVSATEGKRVRSLIAHEDAINVIAYAPDGKTLATSGADRALKLWDAQTLIETHHCEMQPDWVFSLAFSPDGKRLAVGRYDGSLAFYDPQTGKQVNAQ